MFHLVNFIAGIQLVVSKAHQRKAPFVSGNSMTTPRHLMTVVFLLLLSLNLFGQDSKPKIEIYLVDELPGHEAVENQSKYFLPTISDLKETAFIEDTEIEAYEIINDSSSKNNGGTDYYLLLSKSGQEKLHNLKEIPLCCGQRFAIVVNGQPIYGGYFWNAVSSFGCDWVTIIALAFDKLPIEGGLPHSYFTDKHSDPRGDLTLINAFKITGRLIEH